MIPTVRQSKATNNQYNRYKEISSPTAYPIKLNITGTVRYV